MGKVLIVEDNAFLRKMISDRLSQEGHTVIQAKDGEEGLDVAQKDQPNLVLLDIIMPKMDGITLLQKIREQKMNQNIPVMIISSVDRPEHIALAQKHNVFRYMIKDQTEINTLIDAVNFALNKESYSPGDR